MRCPYCASDNTQVKDSRPTEEHTAIRRRRVCPDCDGRFTTFERVQLREMTVVKRSGRKVPFDRDKLSKSIDIALRKRPVDAERVERLVSGLVRRLESNGEAEVQSSTIGEMVMEALRRLDSVAYVRFASVYREFRNAADFEDVVSEITRDIALPGDTISDGSRPDDGSFRDNRFPIAAQGRPAKGSTEDDGSASSGDHAALPDDNLPPPSRKH